MSEPIRFYSRTNTYWELSNFALFGFVADGQYWPTVEHYFQAQKFPGEKHAAYREKIRTATSPKQAKSLGRTRAIPIRPDWDDVRDEIMRQALRLKFARPELKTLLLGTGQRLLIEASPFDRYWGAGSNGLGKNRLGALLMELRTELAGSGDLPRTTEHRNERAGWEEAAQPLHQRGDDTLLDPPTPTRFDDEEWEQLMFAP